MQADTANTIALFPLPLVLFPGGRLKLRIFEQRYLDMVAQCGRSGCGFGISMLYRENDSAAQTTSPTAIGTLAQIVDFDLAADGLLLLTVQGKRRYYAQAAHVRDNGLAMIDVEYLPTEPTRAVPTEFSLLSTILHRYGEEAGGAVGNAEKALFDDAEWVSYRLAETLPLALNERQLILESNDAVARLSLLLEWLPRFQRN